MKIKYSLWLMCILDELDREVDFDFLIPKSFNRYKEAAAAESLYFVKPKMLKNGQVIFEVFEKPDVLVDTIRWEEHWKYRCTIMKECGAAKTLSETFPELKGKAFAEYPCVSETDYEPCADKFEDLYRKYLTKYAIEDVFAYASQCVAYCVKPICLEEK